MNELHIVNLDYNNVIKVIKIVGNECKEELVSEAKAVFFLDKSLINILGKKLKEFLDEYFLIGGIMDIGGDYYEFELILKSDGEVIYNKKASSYMIDFIEFLRREFEVVVENNFDGLEITSKEFEKLLKK